MSPRATTRKLRTTRPADSHCEWLNDRHAGYCREAGTRVFHHPRGLLGILFVCPGHALDALALGKPLTVAGQPASVAA
jgi:hypothetical protein